MTTVPMLSMSTKTLCQWWPLCQCWQGPPKHCANDDHCANVVHVYQNTVPMMNIVPMLTRATKALCQWWPLLIYSQRSEMSTNQRAVWSDLFLGLGKFQAHWDKRIWACLKGMGNMSGMSKGMPRMSEDIGNMFGMPVHGWDPKACWWET